MVNPHVDESSMMTYLSQFPKAKLKKGGPIGPKKDTKNITVSGLGITGVRARVGKPANIIVDCYESGITRVTAEVQTPSGDSWNIEFEPKFESKVYEGTYIPEEPGYYVVKVMFDNEAIPDSLYRVLIGNPDGVCLDGEGLQYAFVNNDNVVDVYTEKAGPGDVTAEFTGPSGFPPVKQNVIKLDGNHVKVHYSPRRVGMYRVNVFFNGFPVEDKPREIPAIDLHKIVITGPGIQSIPAKAETFFDVDVQQAGHADLDVSITDPIGKDVLIKVISLAENSYRFKYTPQEQGNHVINIKYGGKVLKCSPYIINVDNPVGVNGLTNDKAEFEFDTTKARPGAAIEHLSDIKCEENGKFNISYVPDIPGVCNDKVVSETPLEMTSGQNYPQCSIEIDNHIVDTRSPIDRLPSSYVNKKKLVLAFVGIDNVINVYADRTIRNAKVEFTGPLLSHSVKYSVIKLGINHIQIHYTPRNAGMYKADILLNGFPVKNKPCEILAIHNKITRQFDNATKRHRLHYFHLLYF